MLSEFEHDRPSVMSVRNLALALGLHALFFLGFWTYSAISRRPKDVVTPIDLTVVVVENLEGNEDEPPPLKKPEPPPPPPPKPKPKPKPEPKEPDPPKPLEQIVTNIVKKVEKKPEKKKPEPPPKPQKTKAELRAERLAKIRDSATKTKNRPVAPQPNGRTAKKTLSEAEIQRLLNMGYKPGRTEQLATSEEQRCLSLVKRAFEEKWNKPAYSSALRPMQISVRFGKGGKVLGFRLVSSSGDAAADRSMQEGAKRVRSIPGLSADFIEKYGGGLTLEFVVRPQ